MFKSIIILMVLVMGLTVIPGFAADFPQSGSLDGTVSDSSTGETLQGVQVITWGLPGMTKTLLTDTSGYYIFRNLPPGEVLVSSYKNGYYPSHDTVEIISTQTTRLDIPLQPIPLPEQGIINGTISDASTGDPVNNAKITAVFPGRLSICVTSDSTGYYELTRLPVTEVVLYVLKYGYECSCDTVQTVASSTVTHDVALVPLSIPEIGAVEGTVTNSDTGDPLERVMIYASSSQLSTALCGISCYEGDMKRLTFTDSSGHYLLPRLYSGEYLLTASLKNFDSESQSIEIIGNSTTQADFSLTPEPLPYGSVTGTLSDASTSEPVAGAFVFASVRPDHWYLHMKNLWTRTDSTGFYQLDKVPYGTQTIKAFKFGYYPAENEVEILSQQTAACLMELVPIPLPAKGTVVGTVSDASTGLPLEKARVIIPGHRDLSVTGPYNSYNTFTDASGFYVLDSVRVGNHMVISCMSSNYHQIKTVMVLSNSTSTVNFELVPYEEDTTTLVVTVRDINTGEYLANATVFLPVIPELMPVTEWDINWGITNGAGQTTIASLPPGELFLVAGKDGYESVISSLTMNNSNLEVTVYLKATDLTAVEYWEMF